ncbi:MAG: DUF1553 domain-containing protein [Planctomycetes bacterium]|nr:DUF1553 domain-containing protein [Planctomycetota bacterium]
MNNRRLIQAWMLVGLFAVVVQAKETVDAKDSAAAFFRETIEPILVGRCLECHGAERKGHLDLRTGQTALEGGESGPVIAMGKPGESRLYEHVSSHKMPPDDPLEDHEVIAIEKWISDGAYYPGEPLDFFSVTTARRAGYNWWSLKPLQDVTPPNVGGIETDEKGASTPSQWRGVRAWESHPIDRFVLAKLHERGLVPSRPASPRILIRRATYDLTGLPPRPEAVDAFIEECEGETGSPLRVGDQAYDRLIDGLLDSQHYGEHWARHWLDVVRFGESTGFEVNHLIDDAWPYRDYIIQSLNDDKPFDRWVLEHLAGDSVGPGDPAVEVGMTFLVSGPYDTVGNQDPVQAAQIRANTIDEMIRATSESFLGLTVGCARCHDHKFDPISQKDYYAFYATFAGVYHDSRTVAPEEERREHESKLKPLREEREGLSQALGELKQGIIARAEGKAAEYEARWTRPPIDRKGTEEVFAPVEARYLRLLAEGRDNNPAARTGFRIDEFEVWTADATPRNVAAAMNGGKAAGKSRVAEDFKNAYGVDRTIDGEFGERWIASGPDLTIEFARPERIRRIFFSSDRLEALSPTSAEAPLVSEYRIEVSVDGKNWAPVADSYDRLPVNDAHRKKRYLDWETSAEEETQRTTLRARIADVDKRMRAVPDLPRLRVGRLTEVKQDFHVFRGGDPQRLGAPVVPASLKTLGRVTPGYELTSASAERDRRLALAEWIVAPENPLTPRVLVNRLWHYHFGTGLVSTPSDFGYMGGRPSHPDLLDWLARELIEPSSGGAVAEQAWRLKRMHKLMVSSQTYRQESASRDEALGVDGDSRLLWRFPPRRLTGEELRDTMLALAGKLNLRMGGPGYRLYRYLRDNVSTYVPLDEYGPETYRRSIYHQNVRASHIDLMTDFDSPDCALSTPRRVTTTTPLQALTLMNHRFSLDMAEAMAARLEGDAGKEKVARQVRRAYALAFAREATATEAATAVAFIEQHGLRAFCRGVLNSNELAYVD